MRLRTFLFGFSVALTAFSPGAIVSAQETVSSKMVSARDAESVVSALAAAGYEPELTIDEDGEPSITMTVDGGPLSVLFSDCDDTLTDRCDTLVLSTWYERNSPISDRAIREANKRFRYVSVWRDDAGNPVLQWALLTEETGIPAPVFLSALSRYAGVVDSFHSVAWNGDPDEESEEQGALLVANKRGNTLTKIDLATGEKLIELDSCTNPHELATSPNGEHVALACYGGTTVDIFATATLEKVKSIDLGENARPHGIVWHPYGDIYVTAEGRESIFHVQAPLFDDVYLYEHPTRKAGSHMLVVSPDASTAWTTDLSDKTVTKIDMRTRADPLSVTVGEEPEGISLAPDGEALWVSARGSNQAFELDPATMEVRNRLETGRFPLRLLIRPQGDFAVTSDLADGGLSVIDLGKGEVVRQIAVSSVEEAQTRFQVTLLWSEDGERVYVAETGTDTVAEVDFESGEVLRRLPTGDGGDGMAIIQ